MWTIPYSFEFTLAIFYITVNRPLKPA